MMKLKTWTAAVLFGAMSAAAVAQTGNLTVIAGGGTLGEGVIKAFIEPFEKQTGIKVKIVKDQTSIAQLTLKAQSGNTDVDVAGMPPTDASIMFKRGLLEPINYGAIDNALMGRLDAASRKPWGVQTFYYAWVLGLDATKYPAGKPRPESWADFWDVKKYPGTRVLEHGELGTQGPLEEALLADGVPVDKLYPLDVDRAFRSLDRIKPAIRKWWKVGSEQMQLFAGGGIAMGQGFDGRFNALIAEGKPISVVYNQAKMTGFYWTVPKGAKNVAEAHRFIEFATRPEQQAAFAAITGYGPTNPDAFKHIEPKLARTLITFPENRARAYTINAEWYAETGPDGKTNAQRLSERFNAWITQ